MAALEGSSMPSQAWQQFTWTRCMGVCVLLYFQCINWMPKSGKLR